MNGHLGEGNNGEEKCTGRHGLGRKNDEGQAVVDFPKRKGLAITNSFFVKKQTHYLIVRRRRIKEVVDTKVVVGKCVATQHRMVVSTIIVWTKWRRAPTAVKKIKWWKLEDPNAKNYSKQK